LITTIDNPVTERREMYEDGRLVDFMSRHHIDESYWAGRNRLKWGYYPIQPSATMEAAPAGLLPDKAASTLQSVHLPSYS
jgi:hypothetical protein